MSQTENALPVMSVVLYSPERYDDIRRTVGRLRIQTVREKLEVVIVAPSEAALRLEAADFDCFYNYCVVEVGKLDSISAARAAGIRKAAAPIVALVEDHTFPARTWAEALIDAHRGPWAAVGPVISNANPGSLVSWADLFTGYGPWLDPAEAGPRTYLPGHNSSYKRDLLLQYGPALDEMMEAESVLHWDLRSKGHELFLEPKAKTFHVNFGLLRPWIVIQFLHGRQFGAARARLWPVWKRIVFTAGSPLIPLVRAQRIVRQVPKSGALRKKLWRALPVMMIGLVADALGQMFGYAMGITSTSKRQLSEMEIRRERFIPERERRVDPVTEPVS